MSFVTDHSFINLCHAAEREITVKPRKPAPWITPAVKAAKQKQRQAERQWRKLGTQVHRDIYIHHRKNTKSIVVAEKRQYLNEKVLSSGSSKELFSLTNQLLGKEKKATLPDSVPCDKLCENLMSFFVDKIDTIRSNLCLENGIQFPPCEEFHGQFLSEFKLVNESQVKEIILSSPKKSCPLDPLPSALFFQCLDVLLPHITTIINDSLLFGCVPNELKESLIKPLLKKDDLDRNVYKNYRPVSNLPFLSKILEKVVLKQLMEHLAKNDLVEELQSAYKPLHSTETALLKVTTDLLNATDEGLVSVLALLDLSAAFDTIDHHILLDRLKITFGISETALCWFSSYISNRHQSVIIENEKSPDSAIVVTGDLNHHTLGKDLTNFHQYAKGTAF
ncbi:reverse transcriptase [Elysia marginata]|uniref:Reverse transcriptase n=1 Tax=Elysia marginata TaxID=1093978 RepID=A0AAV4GRT9_9GAST|nr:reverse transcriptase [Elysia marginata]